MTKKARNGLFAVFILIFPFALFLCFLLFWDSALPPIPPLPNPNGYNDFVKAGEMLASNSWDYPKTNQQELQALVENNSNALQLARSGFKLQSRVPLKFTKMDSTLDKRLADIKRVAQAFEAEGKLAEMENRPEDAAKSYLDMIHLADESARGGVVIDVLVEIAIENMGASDLQKIIGKLNAKSCRETAATLETLDSQKQTWNEIMQQENDWSHRTFRGIRDEWGRLSKRKSLEKMYLEAEQKFDQQQMKTRQLMIDLAARAYKLDNGKSPASVSNLVPDYLKAIPQNPFTETNMVYLPKNL